jgi:hypothetical protein
MHQVQLTMTYYNSYVTATHSYSLGNNLYIADSYSNRIRKVTVSTGIISTFAGSSTSGSYSGDNGPATAATLYYPYGVALDSSGIFLTHDFFMKVQLICSSSPR